MNALTLMVTRGGQKRFTAAQLDADINLGIAAIGLTDSAFISSPTLDKLPGEFKRITSISGDQVGDDIVHLMIRDESDDQYEARGFGLFLADGTLFATYAQADRLFEKSSRAVFLSAIDIVFPVGDISELRFGSTDFLNPPATTVRKGVVRLATDVEASEGVDKSVVPSIATMVAAIKRMIDNRFGEGAPTSLAKTLLLAKTSEAMRGVLDLGSAAVRSASYFAQASLRITGEGLVSGGGDLTGGDHRLKVVAATADDVRVGTADDRAITPASLRGAYTSEIGVTGRRITPDGFVEIWGVAQRPAVEGSFDLVFPAPFPNACLGVTAMTINTNRTVDGQTTIQEVELFKDRAVLFAQNHQSSLSETGGFRWRAWGH